MLQIPALFAQTNTNQMSDDMSALFGFIFFLIIIVPTLAGMWKMYQKAGQPGWAVIIPFYGYWVRLKIVGRPQWWIVFSVLAIIPLIGILTVIIDVILANDVSKSFGKKTGFMLLLVFLPFIGYPMLGWGKAQYIGPSVRPGPQNV